MLCGSEGTLALIAEARLNVLPIPKAPVLVALSYIDFDAALRDAQALLPFGAASVETIDSTVLALARKDPIWAEVRAFFPDDPAGRPVDGINLVEFVGDDEGAVEAALGRLTGLLEAERGTDTKRLGFTIARGEAIERLWTMRKKAVGLLGAAKGDARPIPFVEDTAVPPERLADFIAEFRALLDGKGLRYGMFGHVDAGVLHVRPAIDLKDPDQNRLIREVTEGVVALTAKYGGLLWGEHGKGFRSEFVPATFGPLMPALEAVKRAFDPGDRMNPGKIASAKGHALTRIDGVPRRGEQDRTIPAPVRQEFRRGAPLQRQRRLLQLRCRRSHVPVVEGDPGAPAFAQGPGLADARMAAPRRGGGRRSDRRTGAAARRVAPRAGRHPAERGPATVRDGGFLPCRQGGDGWLPRLQVLHGLLPDQGRCADLPGEVPGALSHPLRPPPEGPPRGGAGAAPAAGGPGAAPEQRAPEQSDGAIAPRQGRTGRDPGPVAGRSQGAVGRSRRHRGDTGGSGPAGPQASRDRGAGGAGRVHQPFRRGGRGRQPARC